MIVGVDRLDYSKGLEERFLGYERFLVENPEERKEVFLLQIAPPSRGAVETYQQIRDNARRPVGADQRRACRSRLGADPLRQSELSARCARRRLSGRTDRARDAARATA